MHALVRLQYRGLREEERKAFLFENAVEIGKQLELPPLKLKAPRYGYELGCWSERNREEAELALQGKHFVIGERVKDDRKTLG